MYRSSHAALQKMAEQTGGQYYYASNVDQPETVFAGIIGDTIGQIDPTDTDGDGLTDYQETGIIHNVDERYGGDSSFFNMQYFMMRSYPDEKDSDGDGLTDDVDDRPLMAESVEVAKLNSHASDHYLNIVGNDGKSYYGGDQDWWEDKVTTGESMDKDDRLKQDKYYRLQKLGCGTIAMSDAELYLTIQNSGYSLSVPDTFSADYQQTGLCQMDAYRDYIEQLYDTKYEITGGFVNRKVGLYPWDMESGLGDFLKANKSPNRNVKWARDGQIAGVIRKQAVLDEIERMLKADIPVVFAYHTFTEGDNIILYDTIQEAKDNVSNKSNPANTDSHYMTIVGLYKYSDGQPWNYKYVLEVVSWGKVYYINYDIYAKKLDYFSNILSVY